MSLPKNSSKMSGKLKAGILLSFLWLMFWMLPGSEEGALLERLGFGFVPLALIWGIWIMGRQTDQDENFVKNIKTMGQGGPADKREFARLEYPPRLRPLFKLGDQILEVIDISEKGLRLRNDSRLELKELVHGEVQLLSGKPISVSGEVAWSLNNEIGLLMALIPSAIINEERLLIGAQKA